MTLLITQLLLVAVFAALGVWIFVSHSRNLQGRRRKIGATSGICLGIFATLIWIGWTSIVDSPLISTSALFGAVLLLIGALVALYVAEARKAAAGPAADDRPKGTIWGTVAGLLLFLAFLWAPVGYVAAWFFPASHWSNAWRYSLEQDLNKATVSVDPTPHDCEFFTAPIGSKHCHYAKRVVTMRIRNSAQGRVVSIDEGKTWAAAEPSDHAAVFISWDKVED